MSFHVVRLDPSPFSHLAGLPDRIEIRDLDVGEDAHLLNHKHQPAGTPHRSRHAIFVRDGAGRALGIVDGDPAEGAALTSPVGRFFGNPDMAYLHVCYAKRGRHAARVVRA